VVVDLVVVLVVDSGQRMVYGSLVVNGSGGLYGQSRREEHGDFSGKVVRETGIHALRHQDY
jgi:hypothetical protein